MTAIQVRLSDLLGSDLSSRRRAAALRIQLCRQIASGQTVVIDFSDVRSVSDSFSDELFAILIADQGEEWFRRNISLQNVAEHIRRGILQSIHDRLQRHRNPGTIRQ